MHYVYLKHCGIHTHSSLHHTHSQLAIPNSYIVLSLVERQCEEGTYKALKYKCSDEKTSKKVRIELVNNPT